MRTEERTDRRVHLVYLAYDQNAAFSILRTAKNNVFSVFENNEIGGIKEHVNVNRGKNCFLRKVRIKWKGCGLISTERSKLTTILNTVFLPTENLLASSGFAEDLKATGSISVVKANKLYCAILTIGRRNK